MKHIFLKKIMPLFLCLALAAPLGMATSAVFSNIQDPYGYSMGYSYGYSNEGEDPDGDGDITIADIIVINEHTVEVTSYEGFVDALADVRYTDIYFANDIEGSLLRGKSSVINKNKTEQRIYGHAYEGSEIFTFTQYNSSGVDNTIRVLYGSSTTIVTVSDMIIEGHNYYGVIQVEETLKNVTTRYENVIYTGPQPVHNRGGTVEFVDMDITIRLGYGNTFGEISEAYNVIFEGDNKIDTNVSTNTDSIFNMTRIDGKSGTFHVKPGASVYLTGNSYLFYTDGGSNTSPELIFGEGSSFYADCGYGFTMQYVNSVDIASDASVTLIQSTRASDYGLRVRNSISVGKGAVLEILRPVGTAAAIQLYNIGTIQFSNPERVVLYGNNGLLFGFAGNGSTIEIDADAMNIWSSAANGSAEGTPTYIWNRLGGEPLHTTVTWNANTLSGISSNLDMSVDPATADLTASTFAVRSSQLLVLGRFELEINQVTETDSTVTGTTEPNAWITGSYTGNDPGGTAVSGTTDYVGNFALPLENGFPVLGSRITLTSYSNRLRMRQYTIVEEKEQILRFLSVPSLRFETTPLPSSTTYVKRLDPDWTITVLDTRVGSPGFRIQASISTPLTASHNGEDLAIHNGLVYKSSQGQYTPLTASPVTVYSDSSGETGELTVGWSDEQGILVQAAPGNLLPHIDYTTIIHWTLETAP